MADEQREGRHVGNVVTETRDRKGLTRNALAVQAGIDATYLMRLERGEVAHPSFETMCKIADALGCKVDELRPTNGAPAKKQGKGKRVKK